MSNSYKSRTLTAYRVALLIGLAISAASRETRAADPVAPVSLPVTKITLHLHQATPVDVFAAMARQSGVTLETVPADLWKDHNEPVDVDVDDQPYWLAMKQVCAKTGLGVGSFDGVMSVYVPDGGALDLAGPFQFTDGFLTVVENTSRASTVDFARGGTIRRELSVQMSMYPDPKCWVLEHSCFVITEAVDDKGQSLIDKPASDEMSPGEPARFAQSPELAVPPVFGQKIVRLKGHVQVRLATKSEHLEIDNLDKIAGVHQKIGKCDIVFAGMTRGENGTDFNFTVASSGPESDAGLAEFGASKITLVTSDGKSAGRNGFVLDVDKKSFGFDGPDVSAGGKPPTPVRLVIDVPVETKTMSIPFEFANLPIPQ
jgi:hypothetical protein